MYHTMDGEKPSSSDMEEVLPQGDEGNPVKKRCTLARVRWWFFAFIVLCGLVGLVAVIVYVEIYRRQFPLRVDCHPEKPLNYRRCLDRGCLWVQPDEAEIPSCFFPKGYGYRLKGTPKYEDNGFVASLERDPKYAIFGGEVDTLQLRVFLETKTRVRVKVTDPSTSRYEVPLPVPSDKRPSVTDYNVTLANDPQFGIKVQRISTGDFIFDTNIPGMVYSDQFLQITTALPSPNVYGIGEHRTEKLRHSTEWKNWTLFASDAAPIDDENLYGVHPFYMNVEKSGNAHGVFFLNSNAMEVVLQPHPALTFRTIGGVMDFFIFLGPSPEEVVQQYLEVIGKPTMPPYWSLGFQISRWGYNNLEDVKRTVKEMSDARIPQDVQFLDIDYMEDKKDFTYDKEKFANLPQFADELHQKNMKLLLILDPAIPSNATLRGKYDPLDKGLEMDIFIKTNGSSFQGEVWPGPTYYPDFSNEKTEDYWFGQCNALYSQVAFDGLWIDMNEPSNFVTKCPKNKWNYPPYAAGVRGSFEKDHTLFTKTVCMEAEQKAGRHYDVHSLYGHQEAIVTFNTLLKLIPKKRPMILSRSTYAGSGHYTAHWLGDNRSWWSQLRDSIPGMLEFSMFGFPMVGADICGFFEDTTEELCQRWHQLGAFYPFSRNHNGMGFKDQIPTALGPEVKEASRQALQTRYTLLPYLYTCFHLAHTQGSTVARPLFHEFPTDETALDIAFQFLWGGGLMISPIVWEGQKYVDAYFPQGVWYNFYTGALQKSGGSTVIRIPDEGKVSLHVREGWIIPLQNPQLTTFESRSQPMALFVAPDDKGQAYGTLFWDDGESYETFQAGTYLLLEFTLKQDQNNNVLTFTPKHANYLDAEKLVFENVTICGQSEPGTVAVDGAERKIVSEYNPTNRVLTLTSLNLKITESHTITITAK